jgi:hypothetical protein
MAKKQTISNGHEVQQIRSNASPLSDEQSFFGGDYPGLGGQFPQGGEFSQGGFPVPIQTSKAASGGSSISNMLSGINMNQIKGFVDRMGGVEGIIGTMTKVQKVMANFKQMAPMLKLLYNSFSGKVKSTGGTLPRRRRKHRKKSGSIPRKSGKNNPARRSGR